MNKDTSMYSFSLLKWLRHSRTVGDLCRKLNFLHERDAGTGDLSDRFIFVMRNAEGEIVTSSLRPMDRISCDMAVTQFQQYYPDAQIETYSVPDGRDDEALLNLLSSQEKDPMFADRMEDFLSSCSKVSSADENQQGVPDSCSTVPPELPHAAAETDGEYSFGGKRICSSHNLSDLSPESISRIISGKAVEESLSPCIGGQYGNILLCPTVEQDGSISVIVKKPVISTGSKTLYADFYNDDRRVMMRNYVIFDRSQNTSEHAEFPPLESRGDNLKALSDLLRGKTAELGSPKKKVSLAKTTFGYTLKTAMVVARQAESAATIG